MTFVYPSVSGQDHVTIAKSRGLRHRIVEDTRGGSTRVDNPDHRPRTAADVDHVMATAA